MDAEFAARLRADDVEFTERDANLLRAVDEIGSIHKASDELGRSYSRSHQRVTALEDAFGTLVERQRGGSDGGGSTLTDQAHELLAKFERLQSGFSSVAETSEAVLEGIVLDRTGELGVVETEAGRVRAIVPPEGGSVQVGLRADAVTLHDPEDVPPENATSARNRFEGRVSSIEKGEAISQVTLDVGADSPLFALVTEDSKRKLGLEPGMQSIASFKATATRAISRR
ncbi:MAG: TOBE domain-containing protein [Halobacteriales archaeon]